MEEGSAAAGRLGSLDSAGGVGAAVLGQVRQQPVHLGIGRSVDEVAAAALLSDKSGGGQLLEVERKACSGHTHAFHDGAGAQTARPHDDQRSEHLEAQRMCEGTEGGKGLRFIHDTSTLFEVFLRCKYVDQLGASNE